MYLLHMVSKQIHLTAKEEIKEELQEAAKSVGLPLTNFIISSAVKESKKIQKENAEP